MVDLVKKSRTYPFGIGDLGGTNATSRIGRGRPCAASAMAELWNIAKALHKTKQGLDDESKEEGALVSTICATGSSTQAHDIQPWELSIPEASLIE